MTVHVHHALSSILPSYRSFIYGIAWRLSCLPAADATGTKWTDLIPPVPCLPTHTEICLYGMATGSLTKWIPMLHTKASRKSYFIPVNLALAALPRWWLECRSVERHCDDINCCGRGRQASIQCCLLPQSLELNTLTEETAVIISRHTVQQLIKCYSHALLCFSHPATTATELQHTYTSEGMVYSTGGLMGNTRNAHRLMAWAAAEHGDSKQHELAEQLFHGYHSKVMNNRCCSSAALECGLHRSSSSSARLSGRP